MTNEQPIIKSPVINNEMATLPETPSNPDLSRRSALAETERKLAPLSNLINSLSMSEQHLPIVQHRVPDLAPRSPGALAVQPINLAPARASTTHCRNGKI